MLMRAGEGTNRHAPLHPANGGSDWLNHILAGWHPTGRVVCLRRSEGGWAGWNDVTCARFVANGFAALSRNYRRKTQWLPHPYIDDAPLEGMQAALASMMQDQAGAGATDRG